MMNRKIGLLGALVAVGGVGWALFSGTGGGLGGSSDAEAGRIDGSPEVGSGAGGVVDVGGGPDRGASSPPHAGATRPVDDPARGGSPIAALEHELPASLVPVVRRLERAHPLLSVDDQSCEGDVCVFALRVKMPTGVPLAHRAAEAAATEAGAELGAAPNFRWDEVAHGTIGYLWFTPAGLSAEDAAAFAAVAESQVAALGG
jgi:hypothetical protein